MTFANISIIP